jgi:hypothetical protein
MVARHDRGTRKEHLQRDEGRDAEPDGADEVDDVWAKECRVRRKVRR